MYQEKQPLHCYKFEVFKKRVVWSAGSKVSDRTSGLPGTVNYSLYKKKRKHYIIFNNLGTFKDEHFTGDLDWHVPYQ